MLGFDDSSKSDHALWKNSPLEFLAPPIDRFASDQMSRFGFISRIGLEQLSENPFCDTHHCKLKIDFADRADEMVAMEDLAVLCCHNPIPKN